MTRATRQYCGWETWSGERRIKDCDVAQNWPQQPFSPLKDYYKRDVILKCLCWVLSVDQITAVNNSIVIKWERDMSKQIGPYNK